VRGESMKKKYYLKNKKRFYAILFALVLVMFSSYLMVSANNGETHNSYNTVCVSSGDTLWQIAQKYNPNGDIRKLVKEIRKMNNLSSSVIYAGEELKVPVSF
jgi:FOG: LysM repeat